MTKARAVGGFWYSHTFEDVREPNSLCLCAFAANVVGRPAVGSPEGRLLGDFCAAAVGDAAASEGLGRQFGAVPARDLQRLFVTKFVSEVERPDVNWAMVRYIEARVEAEGGCRLPAFAELVRGMREGQGGAG